MARILALPRFTSRGAGSRYRMHSYIPYLRSQGFEIEDHAFLQDDYLERLYTRRSIPPWMVAKAYWNRVGRMLTSRDYDVVWVNWDALPWAPYAVESRLLRGARRVVIDYDDAVFHRYDSHRFRFVRWACGKKIGQLMRDASMVIAGNQYLADYAIRAGAETVRLLPTVVDLSRYELAPARDGRCLNIGWIGTPVTAKFLHGIQPALKEVCKEGAARLTLVGSGPIQLEGVPTTVRPWSEESEVREIQQFDVGVMPLDESDRFCKGKCGLKLIQYMACGVPVVGSPIGVNVELLRNGVNGYQASAASEWIAALNAMKASPGHRAEMGAEGRRLVEDRYAFHVAAPRLADLFREALGRERPSRISRAA